MSGNLMLKYIKFGIIIIIKKIQLTYRNGSASWPLRGFDLGLLARGHPERLRCDE